MNKSKLEYYDEDGNHRATLSLGDELTIWELAEELRLLVQIMGFQECQAKQILPDEKDWDDFADTVRENMEDARPTSIQAH